MVPATNSARRPAPRSARRVGRRALSAGVFAVAALSTVLAVGLPASAQEQAAQQTLAPPTPPAPNSSDGLIVPTLIAVILAGLVLGANAIPSKRGHQD